ncbi:MAG: helix-turn-helix domain-containing protein [Butyrivibrio sp.]|jgi:excisionase family DNA binding protein|uniref:DNA binding domain-containing protein, excisionase family n=1 Tax=Butyrivibrio proteoclasticus TaxID=43305 RepID=A0A1I5YB65_9FIRM|nr:MULTISPECIES: helix-turn-helix domain-containing protein [Butyrivibrio]MBO6242684.1 helix-turn-helix domain-containing protein [Butyrivibrio sp.]MBP3817272.1 helix-turn-helix domain-containing protein [Butyrivibrio sp.]MBQ6406734.1 helix-turn-helix domain-containing protein [Butyrivibrio sp.]SFQ41464.1 DNA binding domain-containing protein, excisionase family [Butyrivibrio proteoclasticus]
MEYTNMLVGYNDILTPTDVKEILKIGRNKVYDYLKDGTIRSMMIAGKYRIPKLYLLEFMYPDVEFVKEAS